MEDATFSLFNCGVTVERSGTFVDAEGLYYQFLLFRLYILRTNIMQCNKNKIIYTLPPKILQAPSYIMLHEKIYLLCFICINICQYICAYRGQLTVCNIRPPLHYHTSPLYPGKYSLKRRPEWVQQCHNPTCAQLYRLEQRIKLLESRLEILITNILNADDIALNEREVLKSGVIWQNISTGQNREPRLLRREVRKISVTDYTGKQDHETLEI